MIKFTLARLEAQDGLNVKAPSHNYLAVVPYLVSWSPNVLFSLEYGIRSHFEVIDVHAAFFFFARPRACVGETVATHRTQPGEATSGPRRVGKNRDDRPLYRQSALDQTRIASLPQANCQLHFTAQPSS